MAVDKSEDVKYVGDNADVLNEAQRARKITETLEKEASKLEGGGSETMRMAVTDASLESKEGLTMASMASNDAERSSVKSEMQRLESRVSELVTRLKDGEGITDAEAKIIAHKYNGETDEEPSSSPVESTKIEARTKGEDSATRLRGQVRLPSPGESSSLFGPAALGAKKLGGGTDMSTASRETHRDLTPNTINHLQSSRRFVSTGVKVSDPSSSPVVIALRASEMQREQRDRLQREAKGASDLAAAAKERWVFAESQEREANIALEKSHVEMQVKQQALERARADRQSAARAHTLSTTEEEKTASANRLDAAEIDVERASEEYEAAASLGEEKRRGAEEAQRAAERARQNWEEEDKARRVLHDAYVQADEALTSLTAAVDGAKKAAEMAKHAAH